MKNKRKTKKMKNAVINLSDVISASLTTQLDQKKKDREQDQNRQIGKRILRLIDILETNQKDFAHDIEITPSALNQIIRKTRGIAIGTVVKICITFRVNAQWLLVGEGEIFINFDKDKRFKNN